MADKTRSIMVVPSVAASTSLPARPVTIFASSTA